MLYLHLNPIPLLEFILTNLWSYDKNSFEIVSLVYNRMWLRILESLFILN